VLKPVLEIPKESPYGRPRADARSVFEAILFILHTGIQWKFLPKTFPPKSTVHDYLKRWSQSESFRKLFARVIAQLFQSGRVDLYECFTDATFAAAKGGGLEVGLNRKSKGNKLQLVVMIGGFRLDFR
jgi:transposase